MNYFVNVNIQFSECYPVNAEDEYDAKEIAENLARKQYPDAQSVEAWDATEVRV